MVASIDQCCVLIALLFVGAAAKEQLTTNSVNNRDPKWE